MAPIYSMLQAAVQVLFAASSYMVPSGHHGLDQVPDLNITLTPNFKGSSISSLDIKLSISDPEVKANGILVTMPKMIAWMPATRYNDGDIKAYDASGPLSLIINDTGSERNWLPSRDTSGHVVLSFRAHPRKIDSSTRPGPRVDLRTDQGGIIGGGSSFLPRPPSSVATYCINVAWNLTAAPEGTSAVWSFGDGIEAQRIGSIDDFLSVYAAGPLHSYKNTIVHPESGHSSEFGAYWFGETPFNATQLAVDTENLYTNMQQFFEDDESIFRVFIRKSVSRSYGGSGNARSFMLEYDEDFGVFTPWTGLDVFNLIAHEMVHEYPLMDMDAAAPEEDYMSVWFDEGIATYYAAILPYRFGSLDRSRFQLEMNRIAAAYYTSPVVNLTEKQGYELSNDDSHAQRLPYYHGAMYIVQLDYEIHEASGGRRSIDDLILPFLRLKYARQRHSIDEWLELVESELGPRGIQHFHNMLSAELVIPPGNSLASAGLTLVRRDQETYELGFDEVSFVERKVVGLRPGTRASLSGLREGDVIVKNTPVFQSADDIEQMFKIRVMRSEGLVDISYWPRTWEKVESYQWVPTEG